jgi:histidinol-phosphate aminotransferase
MATEALKDQEYIAQVGELNAIERRKVTEGLEALGCKVYKSQTNFILFKAPGIENTEICAKLAEQKILIGCPIGMNRVSLGTSEMNDKFLFVMESILAKKCEKKLA